MRTATAYEDLAFHALSFVPPRSAADFDRAVSLWDDAWHARAEAIDPGLVAGFREDGAVIAALASQADDVATLQGLPRLFDGIDAFRATGRALLADVAAGGGVDATWLEAIRRVSPALVEIVRAHMLLLVDRFAAAHAAHFATFEAGVIEAERAAFEAACAAFDLRGVTFAISEPLGARGRGFGETIFVGARALGAGSGGVVALGLYERVVDAASERMAGVAPARAWRAAESVAMSAYETLTRGTPLETQAAALLARYAAFARDTSTSAEDVAHVVARLRRN